MTTKPTRCDALGVCEHDVRRPSDRPTCPGCTAGRMAYPAASAAYPFAPGVIQGPGQTSSLPEDDTLWRALTLADLLKVLALVLVLGMVAGYVVERLA